MHVDEVADAFRQGGGCISMRWQTHSDEATDMFGRGSECTFVIPYI